jgi:carbon-monoxide dehydrogenase large subunit
MAYIGRSMPRLEDPRLLRGDGRYTDDWTLPEQAYAAFVRSPYAHAEIREIDSAPASQLPGVLRIFVAADYLADGGRGIAHAPVPADAVHHDRPAFSVDRGRAPLDEPQLPLAESRVRYPGEAVAVVIAESAATARDAAQAVRVEYTVLPTLATMPDALAAEAPILAAGAPDNVAVAAEFGNPTAVTAAIGSAHTVVTRAFTLQRVANAQLEPRAALSSYDPGTATWLMIAGSQGAVRQRASLAAALGVSPAYVRVICPDVGGGFGPRTSLYPEQVIVTWAARRVGRPVRWTSDRTEAFLTDFQGRDATCTASLALDRDGRIQALEAAFDFNIGAYTGSYVPLSNAARIMTSAYAIPAAGVRVRGILTNTVPTGPYRGAGRPEAMFVLERLLDDAAAEIGLDRAELRARNLIAPSALPYRTALGLTYDSGDFAGNLRRALTLADWRGFPARRTAAAARGRLAGISVANYVESPVGAPHERVQLEVDPSGVITLTVGTQSTGQGHATAFAQVVADELGVHPAQVRLVSGDTARVESGGGTHSDRSMRLVGTLLLEACASLREQARELAPDDPVDVFAAARGASLTATATFTGRLPAHPTGAAVCEVEVDPETGALAITRYVCVDDVGRAINPLILEGQVHGGIVQGLGQALGEHMLVDPSTAQVLSTSWLDYPLPRARGLPSFITELAEDPTPGNALRIKGGGESGITPSLPVLTNAVIDALRPLGVTELTLPLTAARIWTAIAAARLA